MRWKLLTTIFLSGLFGYLASEAVALQYDWGYKVTESLWHATEVDWDMIAAELVSRLVNVPLITTGLCFGCLRSYFHGPRWWRFLAPLAYFCLVARNILTFLNAFGDLNWPILREAISSLNFTELELHYAPYGLPIALFRVVLVVILFFTAVQLGEYICNSMTILKKPSAQLLPGTAALLFLGLLEVSSKAGRELLSWPAELAAQFISLLCASILAYLKYFSLQASSILSTIVYTSAPVLIIALSYLIFALDGVTTNPMTAVLSATAIVMTTLTATGSGALLGKFLVGYRKH